MVLRIFSVSSGGGVPQGGQGMVLLSNGATVDTKDIDGRTPLHEAAYGGHETVIQLLVSNGATVDTKDNDGRTPLQMLP